MSSTFNRKRIGNQNLHDMASRRQLPPVSPDELRDQVDRIRNSQTFTKARKLQTLLALLADHALSFPAVPPKLDAIRAALDLAASPSIQPAIRTAINELRSALSEFYSTEGRNDSIVVEVPKQELPGLKLRAKRTRPKTTKRVPVRIQIKLEGNPEQFKAVVKAAEDMLKRSTGDPSLIIKYVRRGSVIIVLECSAAAWEQIKAQLKPGESEILGMKVMDSPKEIPRTYEETENSARTP